MKLARRLHRWHAWIITITAVVVAAMIVLATIDIVDAHGLDVVGLAAMLVIIVLELAGRRISR